MEVLPHRYIHIEDWSDEEVRASVYVYTNTHVLMNTHERSSQSHLRDTHVTYA